MYSHVCGQATNAGCSAGEREINDGSQFALARNGNNAVTDEYGFYPGGDQPMSLRLPSGGTGVFITDPQLRGTVRAIADADKNATNMEFKTYTIAGGGVVPADPATTTRLRLAGQPYDQGSRLYFMRARYYDPDLGRFLSEDPIGISGGLNLYAYAGNDPINKVDPTGTSEQCGWAWFEWTYRYTEGPHKGEISRFEYHQQWVCDQVADPPVSAPSEYPVKGDQKPWQEPQSLGPPVLVRHGTPDSVVTACVMLRKEVKAGVGRAIWALPLVPMEMVFGSGRLPDYKGVPIGSVRDVFPGEVWSHLQEGTAEALPPFAAYKALDCQHNVLQSD